MNIKVIILMKISAEVRDLPNKTFFNLPEDRQNEIIDICVEEFARHDFESASLNKIIENLGIAKGSFYRYFNSKKDLLYFLIDVIFGRQIEYVMNYSDYEHTYAGEDLSQKVVYRFLDFHFRYINYSSFIFSCVINNYVDEHQPALRGKAHSIILELQNKGIMRNDVDIDIIEFNLFRNLALFRNFVISKLNLSLDEFINDPLAYDRYKPKIIELTDQFYSLLAYGLKKKK